MLLPSHARVAIFAKGERQAVAKHLRDLRVADAIFSKMILVYYV